MNGREQGRVEPEMPWRVNENGVRIMSAEDYLRFKSEAQDRIDNPQSGPPKTKEQEWEEMRAAGKKRIRPARPGHNL